MLVENAQPRAAVEVGLVQSCKPLATIWNRQMEQVNLQCWHHSLDLQHALQQVTARGWTQAGRAGR